MAEVSTSSWVRLRRSSRSAAWIWRSAFACRRTTRLGAEDAPGDLVAQLLVHVAHRPGRRCRAEGRARPRPSARTGCPASRPSPGTTRPWRAGGTAGRRRNAATLPGSDRSRRPAPHCRSALRVGAGHARTGRSGRMPLASGTGRPACGAEYLRQLRRASGCPSRPRRSAWGRCTSGRSACTSGRS